MAVVVVSSDGNTSKAQQAQNAWEAGGEEVFEIRGKYGVGFVAVDARGEDAEEVVLIECVPERAG